MPVFLQAVPNPPPDLRLVPVAPVVVPMFRDAPNFFADETIDDDPDGYPPDDVA